MSSGNILDVYPDYTRNILTIWLTNNRGATHIEDTCTPCFYVYSPTKNLHTLTQKLQNSTEVADIQHTTKKLVLGSDKTYPVLKIHPTTLSIRSTLAKKIYTWGNCHQYQLFNVDLRLATHYLYTKNLFCNARVHWDGSQFLLDDHQWALDYPLPHYTTMQLDIQRNTKQKNIPSQTDTITAIHLNDITIQENTEADTILQATQHIQTYDPDIIFTQNGDSALLPFLYHRAHVNNIHQQVNLGRDTTQHPHTSTQPTKESKSYFSYGRIMHRPAFYTLKGRIHIDTRSSFLYNESRLRGLIDLSRCANIPLQLLSRLGPGTTISQIQVTKALDLGYLIPWKKNLPETWKNAWDLLKADRGGLILESTVGLHENVLELDYASLYPNIMVRYNISPETLLCPCCPNSQLHVPQLGYHICMQQQGLLPQVLQPILQRRFCFKARSQNKQYNQQLYKELQTAWKWVLLVCFGYTGYKNARYGRIECHESITAFSRDILLKAMTVAEKHGYQILHGIIDSLWVQQTHGNTTPIQLSRIISNTTGIKMDAEGHYHWIVFLPNKTTTVGALNRYYGLFDTGELKTRGIELRQHNTPSFLQSAQQEILNVFSVAHNKTEFYTLLPAVLTVLSEYATNLTAGKIPLHDLLFTNTMSQPISEYKVNTLVKAALLQYRDNDITIEPGQSVHYIVTNEQSSDYHTRVCIAELITEDEHIDTNFYLRQLTKCGESLLLPFGYTKEKLENILTKGGKKPSKYIHSMKNQSFAHM